MVAGFRERAGYCSGCDSAVTETDTCRAGGSFNHTAAPCAVSNSERGPGPDGSAPLHIAGDVRADGGLHRMGFHIVERCRFNFAQVVKSTR